jgi:hypothetical protein
MARTGKLPVKEAVRILRGNPEVRADLQPVSIPGERYIVRKNDVRALLDRDGRAYLNRATHRYGQGRSIVRRPLPGVRTRTWVAGTLRRRVVELDDCDLALVHYYIQSPRESGSARSRPGRASVNSALLFQVSPTSARYTGGGEVHVYTNVPVHDGDFELVFGSCCRPLSRRVGVVHEFLTCTIPTLNEARGPSLEGATADAVVPISLLLRDVSSGTCASTMFTYFAVPMLLPSHSAELPPLPPNPVDLSWLVGGRSDRGSAQ